MTPLLILYLGNLVDTIATLYFYTHHEFRELNPAMKYLLAYPGLFVFVKVVTVSIIVAILYRARNDKLARLASWIGACFYGALATYYIALTQSPI